MGVLEDGRLIGAMLLAVSPIALPVTLPGIRFEFLYSRRGPAVERPDTLVALVEHAHKIAQQERVVVLRFEPNIADDDSQMEEWVTRACRPPGPCPGSPVPCLRCHGGHRRTNLLDLDRLYLMDKAIGGVI
jgi:hypothetical protein